METFFAILAIFIDFLSIFWDFLTFPCDKETNDANLIKNSEKTTLAKPSLIRVKSHGFYRPLHKEISFHFL